ECGDVTFGEGRGTDTPQFPHPPYSDVRLAAELRLHVALQPQSAARLPVPAEDGAPPLSAIPSGFDKPTLMDFIEVWLRRNRPVMRLTQTTSGRTPPACPR